MWHKNDSLVKKSFLQPLFFCLTPPTLAHLSFSFIVATVEMQTWTTVLPVFLPTRQETKRKKEKQT